MYNLRIDGDFKYAISLANQCYNCARVSLFFFPPSFHTTNAYNFPIIILPNIIKLL